MKLFWERVPFFLLAATNEGKGPQNVASRRKNTYQVRTVARVCVCEA